MLLSPEKQVEKLRNNNIQLILGEQLYQHGILDFQIEIL